MSTPGVTVAVLAGGGSRRFGSDKRLVRIEATTLLGRTLALARSISDDVLLVVADADDAERIVAALGPEVTGVQVGTDLRRGVGPVAGLEAALASASHELVMVLAADHPRLRRDLLDLVITTADASPDAPAVALAGPRGPEPMLTIYRRRSLAHVTALIDAGTRRMVDVLAALEPTIIAEETWRAIDATGASLADVDTPEDLARLT
jgi:molybdenum cofactor guanylyltransferase